MLVNIGNGFHLMEDIHFFTIIGMLAAGFGWLIHQLSDVNKKMASLESRVSVIETIISIMKMPLKPSL